MPDRSGVLYADSSALVKLAVNEVETDALREELEQWQDVASALSLGADLTAVLTYDKQMQRAAAAASLAVLAPA